MADWNLAPGLDHPGASKWACVVSQNAVLSLRGRQGAGRAGPGQERLDPWGLCLSYLCFFPLCPSRVFGKGLLKVPEYLSCLSEEVFKNELGHRTQKGGNDGGDNEERESRGERGRDGDGSFCGSYPPSLQVLLPNLDGSGLYFSLEAGLLYALHWR